MVSALRERASRQSHAAAAPVVDHEVEFTTPLRSDRPRPAARRLAPRWLDGRRIGLAVSIAGAMLASAIGGALLAHRSAVAARAPAAVAPVSAVVGAASAASAASAPPLPTRPPASAPPVVSAAPAARIASAVDAPADLRASGVDLTFGLDINGDQIPDSLERFVRKTIGAPATRVAARQYYRLVLPLAARAQQGEVLPHAEKQAVFRAAECYWLAAAEDGLADPPNLNDRASLIGHAAADRVQALVEALQGFPYQVGGGKRLACA